MAMEGSVMFIASINFISDVSHIGPHKNINGYKKTITDEVRVYGKSYKITVVSIAQIM